MRAATVLVLVGCGRFGFGPAGDAAPRDDAPDDDAPAVIDAAIDAAPIDAPPPMGPFGAATAITALNTGSGDDDPTLTGDLLEIVFDSSRAGGQGGGDLWTAKRTSLAAAWSAPTNITILNTGGDDATPDISSDGLLLYYASARAGVLGQKDLYVSARVDRLSGWGAPVHLIELSSTGDEAGPAFGADGKTILFTSDRTGNDNLFRATRPGTTGAWSAPTAIAELNTTSADGEPWVNANQRYIVFASTRAGGSGGYDLWFARKTLPTDPFGAPQRLVELATTTDDTDPWLSPDERTIVFGRGGDIFTAMR